MDEHKNLILCINAGSSSIKITAFEQSSDESLNRVLDISVRNIGQITSTLSVVEPGQDEVSSTISASDHSVASAILFETLAEKLSNQSISAIGHRIVHGGPHSTSQLITETLRNDLESFKSFDPEHAPAALQLIDQCTHRYQNTPQIACFDTAFFHDLPRVAQQIALPHKYESMGVRRYGFHGLSYQFLLEAFEKNAGFAAANGRIVFAHLGSGASLAAVTNHKPVDTTMGFTPASGIPMSTRSGDIDPGIVWFLTRQTGMTVEEFNHMVNFESGLLGVSELSADMYTLIQNSSDNPQALEAIDLFCYQVKKSIGSLAASMGGIDSLVFSGGMGEQAPLIRARICEGLQFLGIEIDSQANDSQLSLISSPNSTVGVHVIPTDEACSIVTQVTETINRKEVS